MAYLIQHRRDTKENWEEYNPVLADGEMGFIKDVDDDGNQKSSFYKIGDGRHTWNDLPLFGYNGNVYPDFEGDDLEYSVPTRSLMKTELDSKLNTEQLKQDIKLTADEEEYIVDTSQHIVSRAALISGFEELEGSINELDQDYSDYKVTTNETLTNIESQVSAHDSTINDHGSRLGACETQIASHEGYLVEGYSENVGGTTIQQEGLVSRVKKLEGFPKSTVMDKNTWDNMPETSYVENTLYFIYEPIQE